MMSVENSNYSADGAGLSEALLMRVLAQDWRLLFPWRHRHGEQIRHLLQVQEGGYSDARAAFGLIGAEQASDWLYRDFYLETPPLHSGVDRAIGKLRRGNPAELVGVLRDEGRPDHTFRRIWYEISTLVGRVIDTVVLDREGVTVVGEFEVMPRPSPRPQRVLNESRIATMMRRALTEPLGVEAHRQNLLRTLGKWCNNSLVDAHADHSLALLMHHLELTPHRPIRWSELGPQERGAIGRELQTLQRVISSPPAFLDYLRAGLQSPWRQRRFLCYRLLRLDGHIGADTHPDDLAVCL
ncbi:MAG: hypothetical protein MJE77_02685 [Proteobacteria bacterium]|nr:hypothetical protein [Pseudomonadota bacterium]